MLRIKAFGLDHAWCPRAGTTGESNQQWVNLPIEWNTTDSGVSKSRRDGLMVERELAIRSKSRRDGLIWSRRERNQMQATWTHAQNLRLVVRVFVFITL